MAPIVRDKPWHWAALVAALMATREVRSERYHSAGDSAKPRATAPTDQVVVLQDGGVMRGRVSRSGERYVLSRETGETFIPASNVLLVAASLEEAYLQRRQRLDRPTADDHLALAEWCLFQDLMTHAERELASARALDPNHDRLALIEQRLAIANERRQKQAMGEQHAAKEAKSVAIPTPRVPTDVSNLPAGAVERFTRRVQPVLVNNCTMVGCHQLGGTATFQLDRAVLRGLANRRSTMSNLSATLTLVDREQPQLSPLLTVPRRTHGGMQRPVFGPRQEAAFRHLYEWVALVTAETAKPSPGAPPAENAEQFAADSGSSSHWDSPNMRVERLLNNATGPALYQESPIIGEPAAPAAANATTATSPLRYGARLEQWQPRDEFDPEIFNRKYAPQANVSANSDGSKPVPKAKRQAPTSSSAGSVNSSTGTVSPSYGANSSP
jgi:hypothetical protein